MGKRAMWMRIAAAAASGLLVALLFPPFGMAALAWVAVTPLLAALWSLDTRSAGRRGFLLGWLAGSVSCAVQFSWLAVVSPLGAAVLPLYLGVYWGLFGAFAATLGNPWRDPREGWPECARSLRIAFCHGAVWAGLEWLRGWLFTGFGWNGLGVAFHETPVIAQSADLLGVAGLSMLLVFFQAVLVQAGRRVMLGARDGAARMRLDFAAAAAVVGLLVCYGVARMALEGRGESVRVKALLVQINIPQDAARVLWEAQEVHMAYEDETLKALEGLADHDAARLKSAVGDGDGGEIELSWPDWVIWPESALTGRILRADDGTWGTWRENLDTIARVREAGPFHLIYGVNELEAVKSGDNELSVMEKGRIWNSLAVMSPEDELQTHRKRHLVIFGETIPLVDRIPLLAKIYEQQAGIEYGGSFTPGVSAEPLPVPTLAGEVIGAIPTICFEDTLGRLTRLFVRPGPQVIVNVTNDGWFKESAAAAQHFANARFRTIEMRRPMLRAANSGVSAALDSTGSTAHPDTGKPQVILDSKGSHFTRGSLLVELDVPLKPSFSLYALIGDWGIIGLAFLALVLSWWWRHRPADNAPVIITRNRDQSVVMLSLEDFESLEETAYLMRGPANAKRLLEAIHALENGRGVVRDIDVNS
ncbi:MAG: apolipoprotein N-acyltransferase [Akkermansiaceae bacterium]|nr:apolipoprotein N-acyltransferase [Akkermansiaceae bacterium]